MPKVLESISIGNADRTGFKTSLVNDDGNEEDILNSLSQAPLINEQLGQPASLRLVAKSGTALSRSDNDELQRRNIIRLHYSDASVREWRIDSVTRETGGSIDTTIKGSPLWLDLGDRRVRKELATGYQMINIPFYNQRVDELLSKILSAEYNAPAYFELGNIDSLFAPQRVSILSNNSSHLELISQLCEELEAEWELDYSEDTDTYQLNIVRAGEIGGGKDEADLRPIEMGNKEGNRISLQKQNKKGDYFSRVVPTGGEENNTFGIQEATFPIQGVQFNNEAGSPNRETGEGPANDKYYGDIVGQSILHLKDRAIAKDGMPDFGYFGNPEDGIWPIDFVDAPNVIVLDDNGGARGMHKGQFYLDEEGTKPAYIDDPQAKAQIGEVEKAYRRTNITPFENLIEDFGVSSDASDWTGGTPEGMELIGNATAEQEGNLEHVQYGNLGARIAGDAGEGLQTVEIDLQPTSDNPYFSFWVAAKVVSGGYRIEMVDSNGNVHPIGDTAESTKSTTHAIEVAGMEPAAGPAQIRVVFTEAGSEIIYDAMTLVQSPNAYQYTEKMGARALFIEAARHLRDNSGLEREIRHTEFYDAAYEDDNNLEVEIGSWVRVRDGYDPETDSYQVDFTARVIDLQYNEGASGRIWKKAKLSRTDKGLSSLFQDRYVSKESQQSSPSIQVVNRGSSGGGADPSEMDASELMAQIQSVDGYDSGLIAEDAQKWAGNLFGDYINQPVRTGDNVAFNTVSALNGIEIGGRSLLSEGSLNMDLIAEGAITDAMLSGDYLPTDATTDNVGEGSNNLYYTDSRVQTLLAPQTTNSFQEVGTASDVNFRSITVSSQQFIVNGQQIADMAFKDTVSLEDVTFDPVLGIEGANTQIQATRRSDGTYLLSFPDHLWTYGMNADIYMTIQGNDVYHEGNLPNFASQADFDELINTTLPNEYVSIANHDQFINNSLGDLAFSDTVYKEDLAFTPTDVENIIGRINNSTETVADTTEIRRINQNRISIGSNVDFASGYDPSQKVAQSEYDTFVNETLPAEYVDESTYANFINNSLGGMAFERPEDYVTQVDFDTLVNETLPASYVSQSTYGNFVDNTLGSMAYQQAADYVLQADFDTLVTDTLPNNYVSIENHDQFVNNSLGDLAFSDTVYAEDLAFTPTDETNVISRINASTETKTDGTTPKRINQNKIAIGSNVDFTNGYDPTTKVAQSDFDSFVNDTLPSQYVAQSTYANFINNSLGGMAFERPEDYMPSNATTDDVTEGANNLYYTDNRVMTLLAPQSTNSFQEVGTASDVNFRSLRLSNPSLMIGDMNLANVGDMAFKDTVSQADLDFSVVTEIRQRANTVVATDNGDGSYTLSLARHVAAYGFNAEVYMTINQNDVYHEGNLPDFVEPSNLMAELNSNAGTESIDPALLIVDEDTLFPNPTYDPSAKLDISTFEQFRYGTLPQSYLNLSDPNHILGPIVAAQSGRNQLDLRNGSHGSGYGITIESGAADFDGGRVYTTSGYNHEFRVENSGSGSYDLLVWGRISGMSDMRVKDNIRPFEDYRERLMGLSGRVYERVDIEGDPTEIGLVAQEVKEHFPMAVHEVRGGESEGMLTVDDRPITAALVEGFKMHENRIEDIESDVRRLLELETQIEELESEVEKLKSN